MKILVTGCAGFIGFHFSLRLFKNKKIKVYGIDSINNTYSTKLKKDRLNILLKNKNFIYSKFDLTKKKKVELFFKKNKPEIVVHLAARAGVRMSIKDPYSYLKDNELSFLNIIESCKVNKVKHLIYASTSSVYGGNINGFSSEISDTSRPVSIYAANKKSNELTAHVYSQLFDLPTTGLRFFTVYGPWGRPDMALFLFTKSILDKKPMKIFNYGKMSRDFTYVDDIVNGIYALLKKIPNKKSFKNDINNKKYRYAPFQIFNLGSSKKVRLMKFINQIENELNLKTKKLFLKMQPGDAVNSHAIVLKAKKIINYKPKTFYKEGIKKFISWYKEYYKIKK